MPQVAKIIGGPGTGKTRALLEKMELAVKRLKDPFKVGFVSFTRAARRVASKRAADMFGLSAYELENDGWIKTLHGVCYRCLGVTKKEMLADDKESREWLQEHLDEEVHVARFANGEPFPWHDSKSDADQALSIWDAARNRLVPLADVWVERDACDDRTPPLDWCRRIVEQYEFSKSLDHRCDFTDLLSRFSGWYLSPDGPERCEPEGWPPDEIQAWLLDEQQDTSALLDAVCRRLVDTDGCKWVYVCADPYQSIYGWAGADPRHFLNWKADKERVMPQSYRCPAPILELGERVLRGCSDYWDRGIAPADHEGEVVDGATLDEIVALLDPRDEWLLLARTNHLAKRIAGLLDAEGMPWLPTRGGRRKGDEPTRRAAIEALAALARGEPVHGGQWRRIVEKAPRAVDGELLFVRGTKTQFTKTLKDGQARTVHPRILPSELELVGATERFAAVLRSGAWRRWIGGTDEHLAKIGRWGREAVEKPRIKVGTVHSSKGAEADSVAVLTTVSEPVAKSAESAAGRDEETRTKYVAVTRARQRLFIINERRPRFRWRIE